MHDVEKKFMNRLKMLNSLKNVETTLYVSYSKFSRLSAMWGLYNLKVKSEWSDQSFTTFLQLLKDILFEDNELSDRTYEATKNLCSMSMDYKMIHASPSDCILHRNEYKSLEECLVCERSR